MNQQPVPYPPNTHNKDNNLKEEFKEAKEFYHWHYKDLIHEYGKEFADAKVKMYLDLSSKHRDSKNFVVHKSRLLASYSAVMESSVNESSLLDRRVSVFYAPITNITRQKHLTLREVGNLIKSNKFQPQTEQLRSIIDKDKKRHFKANKFCYATISGIFSRRADKYLLAHSGLICVDLDHLGSILESTREKIIADPSTIMCFISPSGDGLKVIYEMILEDRSQAENYRLCSNYLTKLCGLSAGIVDRSCKDVSRPCFLPYDPNLYIHPHLDSYALSKN